MDDQTKNELGIVIDKIDNLAHALQLPIADSTHVRALRDSLPEVVVNLKDLFVKITGENPWE